MPNLCRSRRRAGLRSWLRALEETHYTRVRVAGCDRPPEWVSFSVSNHRLDRRGASGLWLAAGDAALAVDPLSSSGIVRALHTGEAAAYAIWRWLQGDGTAAQSYERELDAEFAQYLRGTTRLLRARDALAERAFLAAPL